MRSFLQRAYEAARGLCIVAPWLAHLVIADLLLSALLPLSVLLPTLTYNLSSKIAEQVWSGIQLIFTRANGARISVSGSEIPRGESAIVVSNHLSWTDFYMLQALALKAGMLGRCRYFAKQQLKWVPFLGWGLWAMGMPLVTRNWVQDKVEIEHVFGKIVHNQWPIWMISFSEATRYTPRKHAETVEWCKTHDRPIPRHTLYPRTKGFIATVNQLRSASHVKAVYDVTVAYAKGTKFLATPSFWESLAAPRLNDSWQFHVHVERHPLDDLPESDTELAHWLEDRWIAKGALLENLREDHARGVDWASDTCSS